MRKDPSQKTGGRRSNAQHADLVHSALVSIGKPASAYEVMNELSDHGITAPPTIYRALNRLIENGLAHKIESLNAFVACTHASHKGAAVFVVCDACEMVTELEQPLVERVLRDWAKLARFEVQRMSLELRGQCSGCSSREDVSGPAVRRSAQSSAGRLK